MNVNSPGPLARMDRAALATIGKIQRVNHWPTFSILCGFCTYLAALSATAVASRVFGGRGLLELVVVALPLLTLTLNVFIAYTVYRASDEYGRQRILKSAAVTGVMLAFGTTGYFSLEQLGYPHLSMIVVNLVGWSLFTLLLVWVRYRAQ